MIRYFVNYLNYCSFSEKVDSSQFAKNVHVNQVILLLTREKNNVLFVIPAFAGMTRAIVR